MFNLWQPFPPFTRLITAKASHITFHKLINSFHLSIILWWSAMLKVSWALLSLKISFQNELVNTWSLTMDLCRPYSRKISSKNTWATLGTKTDVVVEKMHKLRVMIDYHHDSFFPWLTGRPSMKSIDKFSYTCRGTSKGSSNTGMAMFSPLFLWQVSHPWIAFLIVFFIPDHQKVCLIQRRVGGTLNGLLLVLDGDLERLRCTWSNCMCPL